MIPKRPVPDLVRDRRRFPACAKPRHDPLAWINASAGGGRLEKIMSPNKLERDEIIPLRGSREQ